MSRNTDTGSGRPKAVGEFAFALVGEVVEQVPGALADQAFQLEHAFGAEQRIDDVAILAVVRRVDLDRDEIEIVVRIAREGRGAFVGKMLPVAQREQRILVLDELPRVAVVADVVEDRREVLMHPRHEIVRCGEELLAGRDAAGADQLLGHMRRDLVRTGTTGKARWYRVGGVDCHEVVSFFCAWA